MDLGVEVGGWRHGPWCASGYGSPRIPQLLLPVTAGSGRLMPATASDLPVTAGSGRLMPATT